MEIKFTAWNKKERQMSKPFTLFEIEDGRIGKVWSSPRLSFPIVDCVLRVFIGLKDINGKDIYNEDIVEIEDEYFKIYFNEKSAGFYLDRLGMHKASNEFISNVINELKVVGNIYENPEITNDNDDFKCILKL